MYYLYQNFESFFYNRSFTTLTCGLSVTLSVAASHSEITSEKNAVVVLMPPEVHASVSE